MYFPSFLSYYRIGRFIVAIALVFSFQAVRFFPDKQYLYAVLFCYLILAAVRLLIKKKIIDFSDFIIDIVFLSMVIYITETSSTFFPLLYLFPIFFASISIEGLRVVFLPILAVILYGTGLFLREVLFDLSGVLMLSLIFLAFCLITFAGNSLKKKIDEQTVYIAQLEEERIRMQGYERLFRVSADLAHELRNPLASISASVQFLVEGRKDEDLIEILADETRRISKILNDFLIFSRPSDAPQEVIALSGMIRDLVRRTFTDKKIETNLEHDVFVTANRTFLDIVFANILKNALDAAKEKVRISLYRSMQGAFFLTGQSETPNAGSAILCDIEDDGTGMDEKTRDKIFEPFFTTKKEGTGLGLAIAYRIIVSLGGFIMAGTSSLGGAKFTVILKVSENRGEEQ